MNERYTIIDGKYTIIREKNINDRKISPRESYIFWKTIVYIRRPYTFSQKIVHKMIGYGQF